MRPPFIVRAIEFRHRKTVLRSCLTAVQVPVNCNCPENHRAGSGSKKVARERHRFVARPDPSYDFNRASPIAIAAATS
jgi:hypothetical protein